MKSLSHVQLFATPWTVAYQALLSMGFSRQEYWSGLPFPSPGNHPNPGIEPGDCGLPGFSVREGVLQGRILDRIGQYWLPYPSRALYFLLPYPPTPLSTWCCQNPCNPSSCTTSTPGPHRGRPKSSRAASGASPSG